LAMLICMGRASLDLTLLRNLLTHTCANG
jgi:hypothetical protein